MSAFVSSDLTQLAPCSACQSSFLAVEIMGVPKAGRCLHHICGPCFDRLNPKVCPLCRDGLSEAKDDVQMRDLILTLRDHLFEVSHKHEPQVDSSEKIQALRERIKNFVESHWDLSSIHANGISAQDLLFFWKSYVPRARSDESNGDDRLFYLVIEKIYERLCIFYTGDCTVLETHGCILAELAYRDFCYIAGQKKAADRGHPIAQFCLGYCLLHGIHSPVDIHHAKIYLQSAAERGVALAYHSLGVIYEQEKNYPDAIDIYTKAIESNCYESYVALGCLLLKGPAEVRDTLKGLELLKAAAAKNHIFALVALGDYYGTLVGGSPEEAAQNKDLAKQYYVLAGSRGHFNSEDKAYAIHRLEQQHRNACAVM